MRWNVLIVGGVPLTLQELRVLQLAAEGLKSERISAKLSMDKSYVDNMLSVNGIYPKIGVENRAGAAVWFERNRKEAEEAIALYEQALWSRSPLKPSLQMRQRVMSILDFPVEGVHLQAESLAKYFRGNGDCGSLMLSRILHKDSSPSTDQARVVDLGDCLVETLYDTVVRRDPYVVLLLGPILTKELGQAEGQAPFHSIQPIRWICSRIHFEVLRASLSLMLPDQLFHQASAIYHEMKMIRQDNCESIGLSLLVMATGYYGVGQHGKAIRLLRIAKDLLKDPEYKATALRNLVICLAYQPNPTEYGRAEAELLAAVQARRSLRPETLCMVHEAIGRARLNLGLPKYLDYLEKAQSIYENLFALKGPVPIRAAQLGRSWLDVAIQTHQDSAYVQYLAEKQKHFADVASRTRYVYLAEQSLASTNSKMR